MGINAHASTAGAEARFLSDWKCRRKRLLHPGKLPVASGQLPVNQAVSGQLSKKQRTHSSRTAMSGAPGRDLLEITNSRYSEPRFREKWKKLLERARNV